MTVFSKLSKGWAKYVGLLGALAVFAAIIATPVSAALPDTILQVEGTHIVVADCAGDYAGDLGTCTDQITLVSLGAGAARQSDKIDFGVNRAQLWAMYTAIEFDVAPNSGTVVEHYIGFSPSATAATANPGGVSGSDAAYTGTAGDSLTDSKAQLTFMGSLITTSDAATVVQFKSLNIFKTPTRFGSLVIVNRSGQALEGDDIEMAILIIPLETQIQE